MDQVSKTSEMQKLDEKCEIEEVLLIWRQIKFLMRHTEIDVPQMCCDKA